VKQNGLKSNSLSVKSLPFSRNTNNLVLLVLTNKKEKLLDQNLTTLSSIKRMTTPHQT